MNCETALDLLKAIESDSRQDGVFENDGSGRINATA